MSVLRLTNLISVVKHLLQHILTLELLLLLRDHHAVQYIPCCFGSQGWLKGNPLSVQSLRLWSWGRSCYWVNCRVEDGAVHDIAA